MDTLTHGLLGVAIGGAGWAREGRAGTPTARASLLACVAAAELPDLDYFWPAGDPVLQTLQAHRGPSHALLAAPLWAALALGIGMLAFRGARAGPVYGRCLIAVVFGHLLPDLWTGWGTRLFLPFSDGRLALDWTGVVDPLVTLPLLAGALAAWRWRARARRLLAGGLLVAALYVGARVGLSQALGAQARAAYPQATRVAVFPALLGVLRWRYVAVLEDGYAAGEVVAFAPPQEQARWPRPGPVPAPLAQHRTAREALAWARFPLVTHASLPDGGAELRVADLRYHLRGDPTLAFVLAFAPDGALREARLDRGGSARSLIERWRGRPRE